MNWIKINRTSKPPQDGLDVIAKGSDWAGDFEIELQVKVYKKPQGQLKWTLCHPDKRPYEGINDLDFWRIK